MSVENTKYDVAILVFPGTNCDSETLDVFERQLGLKARLHWHDEALMPGQYKLVVLPGGFSYGDYLRAGAMARFAKALDNIHDFVAQGGHVLGICNGFQILLELGLLPGALTRNKNAMFISDNVNVRVEQSDNMFLNKYNAKDIVPMPIAHADGRYVADAKTLQDLQDNNQIVLRYCTSKGQCNEESNVNGSADAIAGIISKDKRVMGLMPHPERCCEDLRGQGLSNTQGLAFFESIAHTLQA